MLEADILTILVAAFKMRLESMTVTYAEASEILDAYLARHGPRASKVCAAVSLALAEQLEVELTELQARLICEAKRRAAGQLSETERVALVREQSLVVDRNVKADQDDTKSGAIDRLIWGSLLETTRLDQESASYLLDWAEVASIPACAALCAFATQLGDLGVAYGPLRVVYR